MDFRVLHRSFRCKCRLLPASDASSIETGQGNSWAKKWERIFDLNDVKQIQPATLIFPAHRTGQSDRHTQFSNCRRSQKTSSGHGSMMTQSSGPFFTVFMSAVSPPWRSIHPFTVSG